MTPEERRQAAFATFEEELANGTSVSQAIEVAADLSGLKIHVVNRITGQAFGDLEAHRSRLIIRHEKDLQHGRFLQTLSEYVEQFHVGYPEGRIPPAEEWITERLGRALSPEEGKTARDRHVKALNLTLNRDFAKIMKDVNLA